MSLRKTEGKYVKPSDKENKKEVRKKSDRDYHNLTSI